MDLEGEKGLDKAFRSASSAINCASLKRKPPKSVDGEVQAEPVLQVVETAGKAARVLGRRFSDSSSDWANALRPQGPSQPRQSKKGGPEDKVKAHKKKSQKKKKKAGSSGSASETTEEQQSPKPSAKDQAPKIGQKVKSKGKAKAKGKARAAAPTHDEAAVSKKPRKSASAPVPGTEPPSTTAKKVSPGEQQRIIAQALVLLKDARATLECFADREAWGGLRRCSWPMYFCSLPLFALRRSFVFGGFPFRGLVVHCCRRRGRLGCVISRDLLL
jgi:hypothetical protein